MFMGKHSFTKGETGVDGKLNKNTVSQNQCSSNSDFQMITHHRLIGTSEMDELFSSRDRLREFADKLGHIKFTSLRKDVINHCHRTKFAGVAELTYDIVEKMVKNRIQKMIKNKRIKKNWSEEDVKILIWIVSKYAEFRDIHIIEKQLGTTDWGYIASLIPGVQSQHCMFKWLSLKKNNLSENNWTDRESNLLDKIVKKFGDKDWVLISQHLYYMNSSINKTYRCPKQCREHWNCYLNPKLKKGPWSKVEDLLLLNCVKDNNGSKKWAQMIELFNGRTQNALKNRFTLIMEKQAKISAKGDETPEIQLINQYLERTFVEQFVCKNEEGEYQQNKNKNTKEKGEEPKRQMRISLRKRENLRSCVENKRMSKVNLPYYQPPRIHRKKGKAVKVEEKVEEVTPMNEQQDHLMLPRQELSEPEHNYWLEDENKIFQEDSLQLQSPSTSCRVMEDMPQLNQVKIVQLTHDQLESLKMTMLENSSEYVPCIIAEDKLTKLTY